MIWKPFVSNFLFQLLAIVLICAMALLAPANASESRRIALVIGNASYPSAPLSNPLNDATDMAALLRRLGFSVTLLTNLTQKEMQRAATRFGESLNPGSIALFYYAGHGMQARGRNYLIPVDAAISGEASIRTESVDIEQFLEQLESARLSIIILDACRNNPFERRFRNGVGSGLAQIDAPKGTLIAYATAPGQVAADGEGRNGLYTRELLKAIEEPNSPVESVFKQVRRRVSEATRDQQIPWESSSLTGDFYFSELSGAQKALGTAHLREDTEDLAWRAAEASGNSTAYGAYLENYPKGRFAAVARIRLAGMRESGNSALPQNVVNTAQSKTEADADARIIKQMKAEAENMKVKTTDRLCDMLMPLRDRTKICSQQDIDKANELSMIMVSKMQEIPFGTPLLAKARPLYEQFNKHIRRAALSEAQAVMQEFDQLIGAR